MPVVPPPLAPAWSPVLLQSDPSPFGEVLGLLAWIVALAVAAAVAALGLRVWLKGRGDEPDSTAGLGFTLSDLRAMRDRGQLDEEEFEAAKARMIDRASGGSERTPGGEPAGSEALPRPLPEASNPYGFTIEPVLEEPPEGPR